MYAYDAYFLDCALRQKAPILTLDSRLKKQHKALEYRYWRYKMHVYTYSEARQKLAIILDQAENMGKVLIRRKDGRTFALTPEKAVASPLDVPTIKANITTKEIVDIIREGRER